MMEGIHLCGLLADGIESSQHRLSCCPSIRCASAQPPGRDDQRRAADGGGTGAFLSDRDGPRQKLEGIAIAAAALTD